MSFRGMLKHRCQVLVLTETATDGSPVIGWSPVLSAPAQPAEFPCFLDLNFIRRGKDPQWTPEAGRPADRTGVFFGLGDIPLRSGDRIKMTKGPTGTFLAEGAFDEAWTPRGRHHIEIGVVEVAGQIARAQYAQNGDNVGYTPATQAAPFAPTTQGVMMTAQDHGSASTYDTYGCRCQECVTAHAARVAAQRQRRLLRGAQATEHGSVSTYTNYFCRCDLCRAAMKQYHEQREAIT